MPTREPRERWLLDGLAFSRTTWNVLAQQVFSARRDYDFGPDKRVAGDAWDGCIGSRNRISDFILDGDIQKPVVLTGDVHNNWACDLKADYEDQSSGTFGVEFVGAAVTSDGDGADTSEGQQALVCISALPR